jgi:glutamate N-acetyltransferase / amino-acid N-acetyltransferase
MCGATYPNGFIASGVSCGVKKNGEMDLALIVCETKAAAAGIFTKNIVEGHSLALSKKNIKKGYAKAVVINSGNANACLGKRGIDDALNMANLVAEKCDVKSEEVLTASTGVIGVPLDMKKIEAGIINAYKNLSSDGLSAAKAIMTTDTHPKTAETKIIIDGEEIRIGGMAKGSGMIHPDMATMISIITTDAKLNPKALNDALKISADKTFNRISVDGDTSVCDKVLLLASGLKGKEIKENTDEFDVFLNGLINVSKKLAKMLAADGEGATKLLTIKVINAKHERDARLISSAIAKSPLCKTAAFGKDANWGRLLTAAGYSGAKFNPEKVNIFIGNVMVCKDGGGLMFDEEAALKVLEKDEVEYIIDLQEGSESDVMWSCDLTYDYVRINGEYRT